MRLVLGLTLLVAAAAEAQSGASPPAAKLLEGFGAEVRDGFARVRAATARFVSLDSAVAAGYARDVPQCFDHAQHGAMGYHHLNRGYVDNRAEVERPEILLYERHPEGGYVLNGVEYIIPYRLWPRDSTPPTIMSQTMKQQDGLSLWYLHMWIWSENPAGLFADYHPKVKCPPGTGIPVPGGH